MNFPRHISLTLTNACNLRCAMCGQWSQNGYMRQKTSDSPPLLPLSNWKRVVDEAADHAIGDILLRGGEPFLFPHFIELLRYIAAKRIFVAIDTNGTLLYRYAADLVQFEKLHLTISVDGPEVIHDRVRGVQGCFQRMRTGLQRLHQLELQNGTHISKSINFTIMPDSLAGLSQMPDVARSLGIDTVCIVPYYYISEQLGNKYDSVLKTHFGCRAFSWRGFHHEHSGVDVDLFFAEYQKYFANLKGLKNFPYMDFSPDQHKLWFTDASSQVGSVECQNIESFLDIQPSGEANFCIDFPDYSIGNVTGSTVETLWNSERAERFRRFRRQQPLPVCLRCGAKYMALINA